MKKQKRTVLTMLLLACLVVTCTCASCQDSAFSTDEQTREQTQEEQSNEEQTHEEQTPEEQTQSDSEVESDTQALHETTGCIVHSYDDGVVVKEATCTEEGIEQRTCGVCGDVLEISIPKKEIAYTITIDG